MKYFLDTEFLESGPFEPVVLVSIGIVAGDGREYYAVSENFNPNAANDWVKANVLPHLGDSPRKALGKIAAEVFEFVSFDVTKPEFWGYYADYDWVVFCQMFGTMVNLPEGWPMFCRDLKQWATDLGNPKLPEQDSTEHNALNDARWNKKAWEFLAELSETAEKRLAEAEKALGWAIEYIADGADYAAGETPLHDCEFESNPEKGACDFHEQFFSAIEARAALSPSEEGK